MTEELFREDATLAQCDATIVAIDDGGIVLDRTVFYPLGGGQAGDAGALVLEDGREVAVAGAVDEALRGHALEPGLVGDAHRGDAAAVRWIASSLRSSQ